MIFCLYIISGGSFGFSSLAVVSNFLCGSLFSFLLGVYLRLESLGHMVTLCLIVK